MRTFHSGWMALLTVLACHPQATSVRVGEAIVPLHTSWSPVIEHDSDGTVVVFPHGRTRGNIWLSSLTARAHAPIGREEAEAFLRRSQGGMGGEIHRLTDSSAVYTHLADTVENGELIAIRQWELILSAPPRHLYTAILSYARTLPQSLSATDSQVVAQIDSAIAGITFEPSRQ